MNEISEIDAITIIIAVGAPCLSVYNNKRILALEQEIKELKGGK